MGRARPPLLLAWLLAALASCSAAPPVSPPLAEAEPLSAAEGEEDPTRFSGKRAFEHLEGLVELGPRSSGSPGSALARSYLRGVLEGLGLEVQEQSVELRLGTAPAPIQYVNLVGVIPGESPDLVVLAAPYDSQAQDGEDFLGANDGASGSALLLELARLLQADPLPYTVWLAFLDGEAPPPGAANRIQGFTGTRLLVNSLDEDPGLDRVRLAVYFNQVADRDLSIARDLRSHRRYRETFFAAADRLGHGSAFPRDAPFDSPMGGHMAFTAVGVRRVVAIIDDRYGEGEPPGVFADSPEDTLDKCSAQSLEAVGSVSEVALREITATLHKIDSYIRRPVPEQTGLAEPAAPAPAPELHKEESAAADKGKPGP